MSLDTTNTNQHYVSQMLLRGFATTPGSEQVHVFDKTTGKKFTTAIRTVAAERGYYDLGDSETLDSAMNIADGQASGVINHIRNRHSLARITREEREVLAVFVVLQFLRTRGFLEGFRHIGQALIEAIQKRRLKPPPEWDAQPTPEQQREEYLRVIPGFLQDFLPHLLSKDLLLFETDRNVPFCISDNPVALNNTVNDGDGGLRGTLGLAVAGIEIYLPISAELTLAYLCSSIGRAYEVEQLRLRRIGGLLSEAAFFYLQARDTGVSMKLNPDNVRFHNSLQILNAERFVIACRDDFADAADMVKRDPKTRTGPRVTAS